MLLMQILLQVNKLQTSMITLKTTDKEVYLVPDITKKSIKSFNIQFISF